MRTNHFLFLTLIALLTACGPAQTETDSPSDEPAPPEPVSNPYATEWRSYNGEDFPERGWRVEGDELIVEYSGTEESGYGGDLITRKKYKDFAFTVEFMLSDTSNSGLFYLVQEIEDQPIWHSAPEYQLLDDTTYLGMMDIKTSQLTGANYDMHPQEVNYSKPIGEWNTARIVKQGDEVAHYLNDSLVVAYTLHDADWEQRYQASKFSEYSNYASVDEGHLGLQDHGHQVRFRNIRIEEL